MHDFHSLLCPIHWSASQGALHFCCREIRPRCAGLRAAHSKSLIVRKEKSSRNKLTISSDPGVSEIMLALPRGRALGSCGGPARENASLRRGDCAAVNSGSAHTWHRGGGG